MSEYYIASIAMTLFTLTVGFLLTVGNGSLSKRNKTYFIAAIVMIMAASVSEFVGVLLDGTDPSLRGLHIAVKCVELILTPILPIVYGRAFSKSRNPTISVAIVSLHTVLQILSAFFGFIFYVDAQNIYHHGSLYAIYYVAYLCGFALFMQRIRRYAVEKQDQKSIELVAITAFMFSGIVCQAFCPTLRVIWLTIAVTFLMLYIHYCSLLMQSDSMTGLLARSVFDKRILTLKKETAILFFDVDGFKAINDTYGHGYGDVCLTEEAALIRQTFGKVGLCYRYGGDEFCVIMEKEVDRVEQYLSDFIRNVEAFRSASGKECPGISFGYSIYHPGDDVDTIVHCADQKMYENKRAAIH